MYKMLLDEPPLVVLPSLAVKVGLNEAIVLQQVHYWLQNAREARREENYKQGRWWVYNNYSEWAKTFPFWSEITIKRTFLDLEKRGLLISAQLSPVSTDRTKWYTIDYERYGMIVENVSFSRVEPSESLPSYQNDTVDEIKMIRCSVSKRYGASSQNDTVHRIKTAPSYKETETTTEITTETTADSKRREGETVHKSVGKSSAAVVSESINPLVSRLIEAGVNRSDALRLVQDNPEECERQLTYLAFVTEFRSSRGAYVRSAIEGGFGPPTGYVKAQEAVEIKRIQTEKAATAEQKRRQVESADEQRRQAAKEARERIEHDNPALWQILVTDAVAMMPSMLRGKPESRAYATALTLNLDKLIAERKLA